MIKPFKSVKHLVSSFIFTSHYRRVLPLRLYLRYLKVDFLLKEKENEEEKGELYKQYNDILSDYCTNILLKDIQFDYPIVKNHRRNGDEPIWICWLQGKDNMPELNRMCCESIKKHSNNHPVIFVDESNIREYITISDRIEQLYRRKKILPAIYADYIRCALLAQHGGLWLDSTILLTSDIDEQSFETEFYSIKDQCRDNWSVSYYRWASFIMGSTKDARTFKLLQSLFEYFFSQFDLNFSYIMIDYFIESIYQKNKAFRDYINERPYTNGGLHSLRFRLSEEYNEENWELLTRDSNVFKLTYKIELNTETNDGKETIYGYLIKKYLH